MIGAMHIPEKWFPGCLDYYLNSHNIMHVLVVVAVYSMHQVSKTPINVDNGKTNKCFGGSVGQKDTSRRYVEMKLLINTSDNPN